MPAILNEAIPAASHHIDIELQASQDLAYRYTAMVETMHQSLNAEIELKRTMLKEVLYNVRQHEAYLCVIVVRVSYALHLLADAFKVPGGINGFVGFPGWRDSASGISF